MSAHYTRLLRWRASRLTSSKVTGRKPCQMFQSFVPSYRLDGMSGVPVICPHLDSPSSWLLPASLACLTDTCCWRRCPVWTRNEQSTWNCSGNKQAILVQPDRVVSFLIQTELLVSTLAETTNQGNICRAMGNRADLLSKHLSTQCSVLENWGGSIYKLRITRSSMKGFVHI